MNEVEHIEQLVDSLAQYDLDKFTKTASGRMYGELFSFKKGASSDLVAEHRDNMNKGYVARMNNLQAQYLAQLEAKDHKVPLKIRRFDTAVEAYHVDKDTLAGKNFWEQHPELAVKLGSDVWILADVSVVPQEGTLVYDINGSETNTVKIVRGKRSVEKSEMKIDKGMNVGNQDNLFDAMRKANALRNHKVKLLNGAMYFDDSKFEGIASVRSYSDGEGGLNADAGRPSGRNDVGVARPEILGKK